MKSNMHYVIFILIIFALQLVFYTNFRQYETGSKVDQFVVQNLKNQNEKLKLALSAYRSNSNRQIASVESKEPIDMSEFYFEKVAEFKKQNKTDLALNYLDKIKQNTLNPESLAKAAYLKLQIQCPLQFGEKCISDIDDLITQYPDSVWTGKSLKYLSNYYEKNHKKTEYEALNKIIQAYFGKNVASSGHKL